MLSSAVDVVKQSAVLLVFMVTISLLASGGMLRQLAESLSRNDPLSLLSAISSPQIVYAIAASVALYYAVSVLGGAFVNSAEYGSYLRLLNTGRLTVSEVIEGAGRRWFDMALTVMVTEALKYGPLALTFTWILTSGASKVISEDFTSLFPLMALWLSVLALVGIYTACMLILTVYTYPAAAKGANWHEAIGQSIRACRMSAGATFRYLVVRALSSIAIFALSYLPGLLSLQVSSLLATLTGFILTPMLHTLKTAIFLGVEPEPVIIPLLPGPPIMGDAPGYIWRTSWSKIRAGIGELSKYLLSPSNIHFHALSIAFFILGIIGGVQVSSSGLSQLIFALGYQSGKVNPAFSGIGLPFLAIDLSFHNWSVSLATALSGLALMVPTLVSMMFNGFVLGVVLSLVPNTGMFLAAILPHGIVELPSFILAGSVGLSLSVRFIKALLRGASSTDSGVHGSIRQAIYIILGLAPFFVLAGTIEAFVTPFIMRFYGWG